jgi:hypothetical protein
MRKFLPKHPRKSGHNVVSMPANLRKSRIAARDFTAEAAAAGGPDDPRMQEALRLVEAFLAIEDEQGRAALITLAERQVSYDWVRKT